MMIFGDNVELVRDNVHPSDVSSETRYVGLEHMAKSALHLIGVGTANEVVSTKQRFRRNDILFGKLGVSSRKIVRPDFDGICSTDIWVIRPRSSIDANFLFYWCASWSFVNNLSVSSDGTIMPRAKWDVASIQSVPDCSLIEQKAIGDILKAMDDKAEINRNVVSNLTSIAEQTFNSWFVEFDPVQRNWLRPPPKKEFRDCVSERIYRVDLR